MIVYNLACEQHHPFEGWFASPTEFERQRDLGLVECPICASQKVERKLHATRINLGASPSAKTQPGTNARTPHGGLVGEVDHDKLREAIQGYVEHVRENTEYVGEQFADEARAMHYGEKVHRGIRGRADRHTADALREEGIEFASLPFPVDFPGTH